MKRYFAAALLACTFNAFGQNEVYLNEGFEHDGSMPEGWTQIYLGNIHDKPDDLAWEAREGGGKPAGSEVTKPEHAHSGEYNARLYYLAVEHMHSMYLASPIINFENAHKPLLTFWYSQYKDRASATDSSEIDNFEISLYYRVLESADTTWQKIRDYQSPTDDDEPWRCDSIWLPEPMIGQKKIQIAFLGKTKTLGHGCCLDDIKIEETQITNKYVGNITASHPTTDIIPTSSNNNPILKLRVQILGNSGTFYLNSLSAIVTQLKQKGNTQEPANAIKTNGVKLYSTESDIFTTDSLRATTSIVNGKATFNNIRFDMPAGYNYLWITCDIDDDNEHRFRNVKVDIKIEPESINIGGLKYPASTLDPAGDRTINESIFVDDFENASLTNSQWLVWEGEFERAQALKEENPAYVSGNSHGGNANPTYPHGGGNWIIGTDITGKGDNRGGIETGVSSNSCYVETKPFDCYYYKGISLIFYRWLNICDLDTAYVSVSTDEGATWENVWTSTSTILNKSWTYQNLDLKNIADRTPNIKLRFSLGSADREQNMLAYSGWNIDDVALVGTFVYMDAATTAIVYPTTDCGLNKVKPVIRIKNAGFNKIETPFTARYSIDGGNTWVSETVTTHIEREDSIEYQFNTEADLSVYGWYNICADVILNDDEDPRNNSTQKRIISLPNINLPYTENFSTYGYWYSEDDTWQYTKPDNASYCWTTKAGNSVCTLESPCFDMSDVQKPIIEFKLKGNSYDSDGLALYYSTDAGHQTWELVPTYPTAYPHSSWKWYNADNIDALGSAGWSGDIDNWTRFMQLLPDAVSGNSSVKLRFVFKTEYAESDYNFAIDDIRMYESPVDAGVVAIKPESKCHLHKEQPITITIKNFGNRAITPADSLIASVTINDTTTYTDTFFVAENVAKGGLFEHTFRETYDMWYKMAYKLEATTLITGDTLLFSNSSNDSFTTTINVLGEPQYDLGDNIGTMSPESYAIAAEKTKNEKFDQYNWFYADSIENGNLKTIGTNWILPGLRPFETDEKEYYCYIRVKVKGQECYEKDSVKIVHSHYDVGIAEETSVLTPTSFCGNKDFENKIKVTVKNYSTEFLIEKDSVISICYQIKDADGKLITVAEDTTLEANFETNATFDYTFKQQPKFKYYGDQQISYFTLIYADLHPENNSITKDITVWAPPTADLGTDSVRTANPMATPGTLTTELISGAKYKWNNTGEPSLNNNSFAIPDKTTALYKVEVTDQHNCATVADSIQIISDNWVLAELISPTDNCDPQNGLKIRVRIENNSDNHYPTGYKIPATIKLNGNTFNEVITLSENEADSLNAYSLFEHTFNTEIDMPEIGAYTLNIRINPEHDINRNDNTINQEIDIWGTPRLDIGPDTIFTLRPDTLKLRVSSNFNGCEWFYDGRYESDLSNRFICNPTSNICHVFAVNEHECYAEDQKTDKYDFYAENTGTGYCASDTIVIIKTNIDIENIESPIASCNIESFNFMKLTLKNSGLDVIKSGTQLPIMIKIGNNAPVRKEYVIQSPFGPYDESGTNITAIIPFDFNFDKNKTYPVTAWLDWNLDPFHKNDTISTVVSQYPTPEPFTLGDDIYTTNPDTVILHAPTNYYNYSWSGGQSNSAILAVNYIGTRTYSVKVSNQYGCSYSDSVVVTLTHPEIDITGLGFSENLCEDNNLSTISFTLNNIGEDIIAKGSQIDIEYSIDGADPVSETFKVVNTLNSGESVTIAFKQQADFRSAANYALNITARIADTVAVSSKDYTVTVHESPKVSLGKDISTFEQSVTLSAGTGFSSYIWNTGATTDKIKVETDGIYWVTATNDYGCKNSDTINVRMIPATITIYELTNPKSDCSLTDEPITVIVINNGTNTIEQGTTLDILCNIDNDKTDTIRYTLPFDFTPQMTFYKTFDDLLTTDRAGIHTLTFTIIIENVVINTSTFEFEIYGSPNFAFENDEISVSSYPYTLAPSTSLTDATYKWDNGSETNAIEVNANGTYTLTVTDKHKCSATKSVTVKKNASGISSSTIADISVYPNPANNNVNIDFDGQITNDCQILIANASGRIIFASRQTADIMQIDVDDWAQGIYFIMITNNNENRVIKFVKK